jgi:hypothetical protein
VPLQAIEQYLHGEGADTLYARVPQGERIEALEGNIVGVQPGAIIDSSENGRRFVVGEDGELIELPDEGWTTIPDDDR